MPTQIAMIVSVIAAVVLVVGALIAARRITSEARDEAARAAESLVAEARRNAEARAQDILAAAQEQALAGEVESDRRERDLDARETKIEALVRQRDNEIAALERQRKELERRQGAVAASEEHASKLRDAAEAQSAEALTKLERIAGLSVAEARAELLASIEAETRSEASKLARKIEEEAREGAERTAARMVVDATQRVSLKGPVESTISFIALPSDEMKGRIIGREGRNIRALEMATGIDVIIDDTPGAILVSSFDPVRREVARVVIERLLEDGRIHPARIEEVVAKVREEFESLTEEAGSQSAFGLGVFDLHPRLARLVGRLKYRSFHGHNLLQHAARSFISGPTSPPRRVRAGRSCGERRSCTRSAASRTARPGILCSWPRSWPASSASATRS